MESSIHRDGAAYVDGPDEVPREQLGTLALKAYRWQGLNDLVLPNGTLVLGRPRSAAIASRLAMATRSDGRVASAWSISQVAPLQC